MTGALIVLLAVASPPATESSSAGLPDAALLAVAEQSFASGVALRGDSARARPAFARAAIAYDDLWARGHHAPELALDRAQAHRLAGDLPGAVVALQQALAASRWSRPLQVALEEERDSVAYPHTGDLAAQCRPTPAATIGTRMSPLEAWAIAGALWLLAWVCMARFAMTRAVRWLLFAGLTSALVAALGAMWVQDYRVRKREEASPLVVLSRDVYLRRGNSDAWPERLDMRLPRGVEVHELSRRGGWVQVRLAGGVVGWLPETAVVN